MNEDTKAYIKECSSQYPEILGAAPRRAGVALPPPTNQRKYSRPLAKVLSRSLYSNIFEDYQLLINN